MPVHGVYSLTHNRIYVRKFDHDEARARHAAGETVAALAREYGVNYTAVERVVKPEVDRRMREAVDRRTHMACESCGQRCLKKDGYAGRTSPDGRSLCLRCRAATNTERLRFDDAGTLVAVRCRSADCAYGERWQPPDNFGRGDKHGHIREGGIGDHCRACSTRKRRERRHRHPEAQRAYDRAYKARRRAESQ